MALGPRWLLRSYADFCHVLALIVNADAWVGHLQAMWVHSSEGRNDVSVGRRGGWSAAGRAVDR